MGQQHLVLTVRLYEDGLGTARYHGMSQGVPEWPPSPARVFQAIVSGAARGNTLPEKLAIALEWLESLQPPIIAAPRRIVGQSVSMFVPNNDADSLDDPRDVSEVRTGKLVQPSLFTADVPFLYAWSLTGDVVHAQTIVEAANEIYQLGRGVDMAWAAAGVMDYEELAVRLTDYRGAVHRPEPGGRSDHILACPVPSSVRSLVTRHRSTKLRTEGQGRRARVLFTNPSKPYFHWVSYGSPVSRLLFDLRDTAKSGAPLSSWPLTRASDLVQILRGTVDAGTEHQSGAAKRLWDALPTKHEEITGVLIGRKATDADKGRRVRILPIPSIGHEYVNRDIRRVLVEVPPSCPLPVDDIAWAFSGLQVAPVAFDEQTGEVRSSIQLVRSDADSMLKHYGLGTSVVSPVWRTVTPIVLPESAARRRIDPGRWREEAKGGHEQLAEHQRAAGAVLQALRHAGIRATIEHIRVQREPFEGKGARAEIFSQGTRFAKERLWHVEITFVTPVQGPMVLGDGRYMGLGLMRPVESCVGVHALRIAGGLAQGARAETISAALRRALMARVQELVGPRQPLPTFFTGHEPDGSPARDGTRRHLAFVTDLKRNRLLIMAPHLMEHRKPTPDEKRYIGLLTSSLVGFDELRAGAAGKLQLVACVADTDDSLLAPALRWESVTEYRVTRHQKRISGREALVADALTELRRRNLPLPLRIETIQCVSGLRGDVAGRLRIEFATAVNGPIVIGRTCHGGGGLFEAAP